MDTRSSNITSDDLLWLIGQKEADLLTLRRHAHILVEENKRLNAELAAALKPTAEKFPNTTIETAHG